MYVNGSKSTPWSIYIDTEMLSKEDQQMVKHLIENSGHAGVVVTGYIILEEDDPFEPAHVLRIHSMTIHP
jgi:uncharacterized Zn finger protein